jgi:hypothetical protein
VSKAESKAAIPRVTAASLPHEWADTPDGDPAEGRAFIRADERPDVDGANFRYQKRSLPTTRRRSSQEGAIIRRKTFVVIASSSDAPAQSFVKRYADRGVCLMTPSDLSQSGWRYPVGQASGSTVKIGGNSLSARDIAGILIRIPRVTINDVPYIAPPDQSYVAAEMTAFLLAWLKELECPVINLPTPRCLSGPGWSRAKWVQTATRIGIPTDPSRRQIRFSAEPVDVSCPEHTGVTVTIVGQKSIGPVDQDLQRAARALADAAGTELLVVRFSKPGPGARFLDANHWIDLGDREIGEAVLQCLQAADH